MELEELGMPTKVHTGVLYVNKRPVYIVEVIEERGEPAEYVTVYAAHTPKTVRGQENSEDVTPVKAFDTVKQEIGKIKDTTVLGKLANKIHKPKYKLKQVVKPPLFMTDILPGVDTFTGKEGRGFYEREKDRVVIGKEMKVIHGERTGVFIAFDSIVWEKTKVPTNNILADYHARKTLFFL